MRKPIARRRDQPLPGLWQLPTDDPRGQAFERQMLKWHMDYSHRHPAPPLLPLPSLPPVPAVIEMPYRTTASNEEHQAAADAIAAELGVLVYTYAGSGKFKSFETEDGPARVYKLVAEYRTLRRRGPKPKLTLERVADYVRTCPPGRCLKEHAYELRVSPTWVSRHCPDWKQWGATN